MPSCYLLGSSPVKTCPSCSVHLRGFYQAAPSIHLQPGSSSRSSSSAGLPSSAMTGSSHLKGPALSKPLCAQIHPHTPPQLGPWEEGAAVSSDPKDCSQSSPFSLLSPFCSLSLLLEKSGPSSLTNTLYAESGSSVRQWPIATTTPL